MTHDYFIHPTAFVDEAAKIGKNTKIWHFSSIQADVEIGENCSFGQNCMVARQVKIGNGVKVQNNVSIYQGVFCEDDVFLGPSMVFTNVINPRSFISRKNEFKTTLLKKGCTVGANVTIVCGVTIGEYALIGAGSTVTKDVKPFSLVFGVPAKHQGWVSKAGNKLIFDKNNVAIDNFDQSRYLLINDNVTAED